MHGNRSVVGGLVIALACWVNSKATSQPTYRSLPFVAQIEKRFKKSINDHNPTIVRVVYARRSDNSFAQIFDSTIPAGSQRESMTEIFDAAKFLTVIVEPFTKSSVTFRFSLRQYQRTVATLDSENCSPEVVRGKAAGSRSMSKFGRRAIHEIERLPFATTGESTMEWTHERFVIPELRCFAIYTIDRRSDGVVTEEEVVSLQEGEPPPSYFTVPSDYVERSPLELNEAYARRFGERKELWSDAMATGLERRYQKLKKNVGNAK